MWREPSPVEASAPLRAAVGGHPLVADILARRGWTEPAAAMGMLDPARYTAAPPSALPDLELAARLLYDAAVRQRPILVWGDFDVDGQTATAALVSLLRDVGADVSWYVPQRLTESHGIKVASLDRILDERRVGVLLTCDTGIAEHEAIDHARARGLTTLVTDHHDLPDALPSADALVNPKRLPADHSLRDLPGVGVAFKLAEQMLRLAGRSAEAADAYLDLVALGIVADVARQVSDTRYLLQRGLEQLRRSNRIGLQALMQAARLDPTNLTADHIGFAIGPRLNAAGRLDDAGLAVELLTTTDLARARILAAQIESLNNQRRVLTEQVYASAQELIARDASLLDHAALVLSSAGWHPGVIGPVAARLAERYVRPTVLLVTAADGLARGSARSVPGVDLSAALRLIRDHVTGFGGHPGAAGVWLRVDDIALFRAALSRAVEAVRDPLVLPAGILIDAYVGLADLTLDLARQINRLGPFGEGHPPVSLAVRDVSVADTRVFGRHGEHRQVVIEDDREASQRVTWWRGADEEVPGSRFDVAVALKSVDLRGAPALSIEWLGARMVPAAPIEARAPALEVIDWRAVPDVIHRAAALPQASCAIWADGEPVAGVVARRRYDLEPAEALVVWRAPAGPAELASALDHVSPRRVYLCDAGGSDDGLNSFARRLAGMLKHDVNRRGGHVDVPRLAAAAGHRPATVRTAIEWLAARGQIAIVEEEADALRIAAAGGAAAAGEQSPDELQLQLRALLAETAAYRSYYRRAEAMRLVGRG